MANPALLVVAVLVTMTSAAIIPIPSLTRAPGTYYFGNTAETWDSAQRLCSEAGLKLLVIESSAEQNVVNSYLRATNFNWVGTAWIGGVDLDGDGVYHWHPTVYSFAAMKYTNFLSPPVIGQAVTISNEPGRIGKWGTGATYSEVQARMYFCEA